VIREMRGEKKLVGLLGLSLFEKVLSFVNFIE
jgi:hypothetical protein